MNFQHIAIITPVFNDWESFIHLIEVIDKHADSWSASITVIAVDDGSTPVLPSLPSFLPVLKNINQVEILSLVCNMGHQRAIAIGLCTAFHESKFDIAVVMDCDGEDSPDAIGCLLTKFRDNHQIVVAQRGKRSEGTSFRFSYNLYKVLFFISTGKVIDFGNFCVIPQALLSRIVFIPDLWNNLAATLIKSRLPLCKVRINRGKRYSGKSKMNFVSLVIHGLSAISVYSDIVFVRIMVLFLSLSVLMLLAVLIVVTLRLLTDLAIPGWASYLTGLLSILLLQTLLFSTGAAFLLLNRRSSPLVVPAIDAPRYIRDRTVVFNHE